MSQFGLANALSPTFSNYAAPTSGLMGYSSLGSASSNAASSAVGNAVTPWASPWKGLDSFNTQGTSFFDKIGGFGGIMDGLGAIASLGSMIGGFQSNRNQVKLANQALGLAREQFAFEKGLANRNLLNQATTVNNLYDSQANIAGAIAGASLSDERAARYGVDRDAIKQQYASKAEDRHVDGSPIQA